MSRLPTVILAGYLAGSGEYESLRQDLERLGYPTRLVPIRARDWIPTVGGRPMTPVLERLAKAIADTCAEFGSDRVNLIGHSAGGWVARIFLGAVPYCGRVWAGRERVATLVTLGTPHVSRERWTLTNLNFVNDNYPGAFHAEVKYVCVAGRAVQGVPFRPGSWLQGQGKGSEWLAYSSYQLTVGVGDVWGDGITPIEAAHLPGALNLVAAGAYHSPRSPVWYGSEGILEDWVGYLR